MKLINKHTDRIHADFRNEQRLHDFLTENPTFLRDWLIVYSGGLVLTAREFHKADFIQACPSL